MSRLAWGLQPPTGTTVAWGARAITEPGGALDLVWDRQAALGVAPERQRMQRALDRLLPCARAEWRRQWLKGLVCAGESRRVVLANDGEWTIEADSCASHGYAYLVAYPSVARDWDQLHVCTPQGEDLEVAIEGDRYVLYGSPTGEHCIDVDCSPPERLAVHFAGYVRGALRVEVAS